MSGVIGWMAAEEEAPNVGGASSSRQRTESDRKEVESAGELAVDNLPAHQFPRRSITLPEERPEGEAETTASMSEILREYEEIESEDENRRRRICRGRTVAMLRRYMKYSIETGRLPSLLGQEFFRAKVTSYSVVTFEDRVIFVHDMEKCLERLDDFSRQLIARHVLQEHDQAATAKLLHCTERTVRRLIPIALDQCYEILLEMGLMERVDSSGAKSCQEGWERESSVSDCEQRKNNF